MGVEECDERVGRGWGMFFYPAFLFKTFTFLHVKIKQITVSFNICCLGVTM